MEKILGYLIITVIALCFVITCVYLFIISGDWRMRLLFAFALLIPVAKALIGSGTAPGAGSESENDITF